MQVNVPYLQVVGTSKIHTTRLPSILNVVLLSLLYTLLSKTQVLGATTLTSIYATSEDFRLRIGISSLSFNIKT